MGLVTETTNQPPFYGHYTAHCVSRHLQLSSRILLVQSFTARMPLLMATSSQGTENGAKKVTLRIFQFPCQIYTIYMQIHEKV